jgi:hypothetical protein
MARIVRTSASFSAAAACFALSSVPKLTLKPSLLPLPVDDDEAIRQARYNSDRPDDDDSNDSMFSSALKFAKTQYSPSSSSAQEPVNEQQAMNAHEQAYQQGNAGSMDGNSMAMAAAMQAMKMFTGGGNNNQQQQKANSGGGQSGMVSFLSLASPPFRFP